MILSSDLQFFMKNEFILNQYKKMTNSSFSENFSELQEKKKKMVVEKSLVISNFKWTTHHYYLGTKIMPQIVLIRLANNPATIQYKFSGNETFL
ncbi:hypothetical protein Halhy_5244 [Haliscomenobacter hydrossis DSM 1100]|uniref:Uncharacterized protein n=1 Tax=Haliscomenobacter hydrossis (strain ATCC 27775 / DSM 1100 / LMG 10767 / O) TaxID=760192 RepID=F4L610_HALH1|nr:hypothetical protein Halhy_5244 [Haliscomenobacter hydrossis DSM 1100]